MSSHATHANNLFACNEKIAHVMPCGTACSMTSCVHYTACACRQKQSTVYIRGAPGITYGHAIRSS